jgi:uncharacterized protein
MRGSPPPPILIGARTSLGRDHLPDMLAWGATLRSISRIKILLAAAVVIGAFLLLVLAACDSGPRVRILDSNGVSMVVVRVEIADTQAAREIGLMYRQHLAENAGMLFVFNHPQHLTFWMKNTEIPLDMIFAAADRTVTGIIANAEPFSERQLSADGEAQYVLEVNGGFTRLHGIKPGDRLQFVGVTPTAKD